MLINVKNDVFSAPLYSNEGFMKSDQKAQENMKRYIVGEG